jgi:hypothetical protein
MYQHQITTYWAQFIEGSLLNANLGELMSMCCNSRDETIDTKPNANTKPWKYYIFFCNSSSKKILRV